MTYKMRVYYESKENNLEVVLQVNRDTYQIYETEEIGIRNQLSCLSKKYFDRTEKKIFGGLKIDRKIWVNGNNKNTRQFHFYNGSKENLDKILIYCKENKIKYKKKIPRNIRALRE